MWGMSGMSGVSMWEISLSVKMLVGSVGRVISATTHKCLLEWKSCFNNHIIFNEDNM